MSQIKFKGVTKDGIKVEVVGGWDPPLQEFFLNLYRLGVPEDEDDVLWSALDYPAEEDRCSTKRLRAVLEQFGVRPPSDFWYEVERKLDGITVIELRGSGSEEN